MKIEAKVVEDSRSLINGDRLTTLQLIYPRYIHAELMTHRVFSRNASSTPRDLDVGEWHLPYISDHERQLYHSPELVKASTARCARTSFMNHDGTTPVLAKDLDLHDKLVIQDPLHASPSEHQATPNGYLRTLFPGWTRSNFSSGWAQYRKFLETGRDVR